MELKPGYRQTEVGAIPEDWALKTLGELFVFSGGYSASRAQLSDRGFLYLHYGDIHGATQTVVDTEADCPNIPRLDVQLKDVSRASLLEDGDIVFVDASEDDEGVSKHVVIRNATNVPFISGLHTIVAKASTGELNRGYRQYCFQSPAIRKQFLYYAVGTKVKGISKTNLPKLLLPIPPLPEQRAIAAALSDVDALLAGLDRLIAKKRDLKQAAMHQLITGQTRLPGFCGEWEARRLCEIGTFTKGKGIRREDVTFGGLPCVRYGEIYTRHCDYIRQFYSFIPPRVAQESQRLRKGDLLFAGSGETAEEIGKCVAFLGDEEAYAGGDIVILSPLCQNSMYLGYVMNQAPIIQQKARMGQGDAVVHISARQLSQLELRLPAIDEQSAIAIVLSDIDAEITSLEARRDKTRALKNGMMQELLTGRTRLIAHEITNA